MKRYEIDWSSDEWPSIRESSIGSSFADCKRRLLIAVSRRIEACKAHRRFVVMLRAETLSTKFVPPA